LPDSSSWPSSPTCWRLPSLNTSSALAPRNQNQMCEGGRCVAHLTRQEIIGGTPSAVLNLIMAVLVAV
jgi:hypothetical protein